MSTPQAYFYGDDPNKPAAEKLLVFFHDMEVQDMAETNRQGRPIYRMRTFLTKLVPGDKNNVIDRPMRPEDQAQFPQAWANYQAKQTDAVSGTPLQHWPLLNRAQVAEMKALNIFTVEALAALPDSFAQRIMGANELRRKAQTFLDSAKNAAAAEQAAALKQENAELRTRLEALEAAMQEKPKRTGWPKGKPRGPRKAQVKHGTDAAPDSPDGG